MYVCIHMQSSLEVSLAIPSAREPQKSRAPMPLGKGPGLSDEQP